MSNVNQDLPKAKNINELDVFSFKTPKVDSVGNIIKWEEGQASQKAVKLPNHTVLEMVYIPEGEFLMGTLPGEGDVEGYEYPQHNVKIAKPFYMGKYPVTQEQYQAVMGMNPSTFQGKKCPAESMTWDDATLFCKKLSKLTGTHYRLPSEAEWEYACRAGTTTPFYFGETITPELVNYNGDYPYANASKGLYRLKTTEVGSFPPNAFGLYDMHGNVAEWCEDLWHSDYNDAPNDGSAWMTGDDECRVLRGSSWDCNAEYCRSASRGFNLGAFFMTGFRVVCE